MKASRFLTAANVLSLTLLTGIGCAPAPEPADNGRSNTGGTSSTGSGGSKGNGTGGSTSTGSGGAPSTSGGSGGSNSGTGGGPTGSGGATGTGGLTGTGGTSPNTGGTSGSADAGSMETAPATDSNPGAGDFKLDVKGFMVMAGKNYFPASATAPGGQHSPAMEWPGAPATAKSFAVTLVDNSEQMALGGKSHWVLWDIPATTKGLAAELPKMSPITAPAELMGAKQVNLVGAGKSYFGPGAGGSRPYRFTVWALDVAELPVAGANLNTIIRMILPMHKIATATFDGIGYK
jgi:Raf kinase inhibitor-like YbhB/YbcL family protein